MSDCAALVVAAGRGSRAGGDTPKQYRMIAGEPMLARTLEALLRDPRIGRIQVVTHPDDVALYEKLAVSLDDQRVLPPVFGGETRALSVLAGLHALADAPPELVLIHDAARPFLSTAILDRIFDALADADGAFPALPVVDALWTDEIAPVSRDGLLRAQTPQAFHYAAIRAAHVGAGPDATDDVAVARAAGLAIVAVTGEEANFKVTQPDDFERAETMCASIPDIRTGTGYDVHALTTGDHVILCGVTIPHDRALKGHSDADVAMHAITDAIYGALAEGDIGQWFPPSDAEWKGADSRIFLEHAIGRVAARGFTITHIDTTIICEQPKIGPHAQAMRERLSVITGLDISRISVKATTSERLGFTGRSEGIAAMATATLVAT